MINGLDIYYSKNIGRGSYNQLLLIISNKLIYEKVLD